MKDSKGQLDLLGEGAEVPQANNLELLVALMEAIERGVRSLAELAAQLEVEGRTIRYYADLGRWLGFLRPNGKGEWAPTETGAAFAGSVSARGRLFSQALFQKDVVRLANHHKRQALDEGRELTTRDACLRAIERATDLSESTAKRRASSLASLLEAAYRPSRVNWQTGQMLDERRHPALEFDGESFLTALAMRELGVAHPMKIGFPKQVERFVRKEAHQLARDRWKRASWSGEARSQWFGSVPVNDITCQIALRGGRDLRQLLVLTVPYVTITCAFLALRDPLDRPITSITEDMYGIRFWYHEVELESPTAVIEQIALALDIEPGARPPQLSAGQEPDAEPAGDASLISVLVESGICRRDDTVLELAPGVRAEWQAGSEDAPSIAERLKPLRESVGRVLRGM